MYDGLIPGFTQQIETDFLIVGAGVAGMRAAIELAPHGRVLVVAKDRLTESNSEYAQGGIAAALGADDSVDLHFADTIAAGAGLCYEPAVRALVDAAPNELRQLIAWGAEFDTRDGQLLFAREGAHSRSRVLHANGDSTGREIARALYTHAASLTSIEFRSFSGVLDLLVDGSTVCGAVALDEATHSLIAIRAAATLIATGGLGCVFLDTTNPDVATGDGVAAAWRAGASVADIEFVQFHPTALHIDGAPRFLLSEALRGEGAHLVNAVGERFMRHYHALGELAPRDVVSRAIVTEMRRLDAPHVYLDLTHLGAGFARERFPRIYATCLRHGVDLDRDRAPVHPAAHYAMGGIATDLDGRTSLHALYAAGEAACAGVHGANRLASNSLLEGLVYGARAARAMHSDARGERSDAGVLPEPLRIPRGTTSELRALASAHCGIYRRADSLDIALTALSQMPVEELAVPSREQAERRNVHTVATLIARAALAREESRGAHQREEFPAPDERFALHSCQRRASSGVEFTRGPLSASATRTAR